MATFRIYEDQENRVHNPIGRGKDKINALVQNKRTVLGVLQSNRVNEFCKDEKLQIKTKTAHSNHTEQYSLFDENFKEPAFKVYEDKLIKETSVALRESKKENETITSSSYICNESETIAYTSLSSSRPALQEITAKVNEQSVIEKNEIKSHKPQEEELNNSFVFEHSFFTDIKSKREATKARSDLFDVDIYRADIYNYLRVAETQHRPKPGYINKQPDITNAMRAILVDWLVEVSEEYKLHNETLYLAVSYIDRFLSYMSVVRAKLQLVGTAAMFIAAKYEEIYPPDIGEFVYITDDTYTKKQVLKMEHLILRVLSFDLTVPTPITFLMHYCTHNNLSDKIKYLAMYLCELAMLEGDPYLQYVPSLLSASAIVLAQHTLREEVWPHELELSSGYNLEDLKECVSNLNKTFRMAGTLQQQSIQEKYKASKYGHVAHILPRNSEIYDDDSEA